MKFLMQTALLSWILVVGAKNESFLVIQESRNTEKNEATKFPASKQGFETLEELMKKMNEKLENNVKRRNDILVTNKIQLSVIIGMWTFLTFLWITCNVRIYLGRKRDIHRLEKHYQKTVSQLLENKRKELEKKTSKGKKEKRKKQMQNVQQFKGLLFVKKKVKNEVQRRRDGKANKVINKNESERKDGDKSKQNK
ncbi:hypothetical protein ACH3XW_22860 [Acanthocheilonema viteae]